MLKVCRRKASTMRGRIQLGFFATSIFVMFVAIGLLMFAKPHAVFATGERVSDPWAVCVDGKQVALVEDKEAAESVKAGVVMKYADTFSAQQDAEVKNDITIQKYDFEGKNDEPIVNTTEEAVDKIVNAEAADGSPLVEVRTEATVTDKEKIAHTTKTVRSDQVERGKTKVKVQGQDGVKEVTKHQVMVNGEVAATEVLDEEVTRKPVQKVVLKGGPSGVQVVKYAKNYVGNPYVWGGSSLTHGTDCSGFTMSVYAKYGISLPHNSYAQGKMGKAVKNPIPGDLVCYGGHVGIYVGNGQMVHASTSRTGIIVSSVNYRPHWYRRLLY